MCEGTGCWDHSWHTVNYTRIYTQQSRVCALYTLQSGCQIAICATDSVWSRHGADFGCNVVAYNCTTEHSWLQSILCVSGPEREMQWDSCALAKALWLGNCPEMGKHGNGSWPMATRAHPSLNDKSQGVFLQLMVTRANQNKLLNRGPCY